MPTVIFIFAHVATLLLLMVSLVLFAMGREEVFRVHVLRCLESVLLRPGQADAATAHEKGRRSPIGVIFVAIA
jgi:hypothetical protein